MPEGQAKPDEQIRTSEGSLAEGGVLLLRCNGAGEIHRGLDRSNAGIAVHYCRAEASCWGELTVVLLSRLRFPATGAAGRWEA